MERCTDQLQAVIHRGGSLDAAFIERYRQVRQMPASPDKYWAGYCLAVLKDIEDGKPYEVMSKYQGTNFKNGIKRFFAVETEIKESGEKLS